MGKINNIATVTLEVNGKRAKQVLADVEKQIKATTNEVERLKAANADPAAIEREKKKLRSLQKEYREMQSAVYGVKESLDNLNLSTPRQLESSVRHLRAQLKGMVPDTDGWKKATNELQRLESRLRALRQQMKGQESLWQRFSKWWYQCGQAVAAVVAGFNLVMSKLRGFVNDYAELEEAIADTRKFTGIAEEGVRNLNEEFKKMDTRTPLEKLHALAQEAGRLGKNTEADVLGYVRAADITNVALSELGEGATETIAKIAGIFNVDVQYGTEQSILKVGSTVNDLAQKCSATSGYIVEFSNRLAGAGAQAKMTVPEIMAFGAVLGANAQNVEMSATALSQTIMKLFQKPKEIAKAVGLDVEEFTKTLQRDTTEGLMMFLEAISKMGGDNGLANLSPLFKDLGLDGARMSTVLSVLAGKLDMVKEKINEANIAFAEGTSTSDEFGIFNNTVQARLDKARKKLQILSAELGERLYPVMIHITSASSAAMKVLLTTIQFVDEHKAAVVSLTAAITTYTLIVHGTLILERARLALSKLRVAFALLESKATATLTAVTEGLRLVYFKLTGQVTKAMVAQKAFSAALSATPWGAILTAVVAAVVAFKTFDTGVKELVVSLDTLKKGEEEANAKLKEERAIMDENIKSIASFNGSKSEEQRLIDSLNERYGGFFGTYKTLKEWYDILTKSGNDYCNSIYQQIQLEAKHQQALDLIKQANDLRAEGGAYVPTTMETLDEFVANLIYLPTWDHLNWGESKEALKRRYRNGKNTTADALEAQADALIAEYAAGLAEDGPFQYAPSATPETSTPYKSQKLADKEARLAKKNAREAALARKRELAKAKKEYQSMMESAKGDWESGSADNVVNLTQGLVSYEDYLAEKERLDLKYIDDRIAAYNSLYEGESEAARKLLLLYDEDYQELLLKRAELEKKHSDEAAKRRISDLQREYKKEVEAWTLLFNDPDSDWYGDSFAQQEKLHQLKIEYLTKYRDTYKDKSKEWVQYQQQLEDTGAAYTLERRKAYLAELEKWRKKYDEQSLERRKALELATLKALLDANRISLEEYMRMVGEVEKAFMSAKELVGNQEKDNDKAWFERIGMGAELTQMKKKLEKQNAELARQLAAGEITVEEYNKKIEDAQEKSFEDMMRKFTSSLDPLGQSALSLAATFADVFKSISDNGKISFENIADIAVASFAAMGAGLSVYSQFAEAQSKIDIANTERKYDKEIEAMQGNTYKTTRLEKKKEAEIAKLKADATKKEFNIKVSQAIANTAQSAILGYMAGLEAGFPMALWLAPTLAGLATATGMVQLAMIKKQQKAAEAQGYAEGGFTRPGSKYEPAGIVHAGEWVASQRLLASPVARPLIEALDYAQRTNTIGSLKSEDVSRAITAPQSLSRIMEGDASSALVVAAVAQSSKVMKLLADRLDKPIAAITTVSGNYGINKAQEEYASLLRNVTPKSKQR